MDDKISVYPSRVKNPRVPNLRPTKQNKTKQKIIKMLITEQYMLNCVSANISNYMVVRGHHYSVATPPALPPHISGGFSFSLFVSLKLSLHLFLVQL